MKILLLLKICLLWPRTMFYFKPMILYLWNLNVNFIIHSLGYNLFWGEIDRRAWFRAYKRIVLFMWHGSPSRWRSLSTGLYYVLLGFGCHYMQLKQHVIYISVWPYSFTLSYCIQSNVFFFISSFSFPLYLTHSFTYTYSRYLHLTYFFVFFSLRSPNNVSRRPLPHVCWYVPEFHHVDRFLRRLQHHPYDNHIL